MNYTELLKNAFSPGALAKLKESLSPKELAQALQMAGPQRSYYLKGMKGRKGIWNPSSGLMRKKLLSDSRMKDMSPGVVKKITGKGVTTFGKPTRKAIEAADEMKAFYTKQMAAKGL